MTVKCNCCCYLVLWNCCGGSKLHYDRELGRQLKQRDVVPALFYSGGPTEIDLWEIATEILQELVEAE